MLTGMWLYPISHDDIAHVGHFVELKLQLVLIKLNILVKNLHAALACAVSRHAPRLSLQQ